MITGIKKEMAMKAHNDIIEMGSKLISDPSIRDSTKELIKQVMENSKMCMEAFGLGVESEMSEGLKKFPSIAERDKFILTAPQEEVEKYLREVYGEDAFNQYKQNLRELEDTLIHGTGTKQPMGILNFKEVK